MSDLKRILLLAALFFSVAMMFASVATLIKEHSRPAESIAFDQRGVTGSGGLIYSNRFIIDLVGVLDRVRHDLKIEIDKDVWRCASCRKTQPGRTPKVWVPTGPQSYEGQCILCAPKEP